MMVDIESKIKYKKEVVQRLVMVIEGLVGSKSKLPIKSKIVQNIDDGPQSWSDFDNSWSNWDRM